MAKSSVLMMLALLALACNNSPGTAPAVVAQSLVSPQDFALDVVVGLLRQSADVQFLESRINDPASGIDNVDIDRDGKVDYVMVRETQVPSGKKMDLIAHPSAGSVPDQPIAAITFSQGVSGVDVQAGYAPFIDRSGSYYYRDTLGAELAFARWLFMPRPYYVSSVPAGFAYHGRLAGPALTQSRSTFSSQTRVSPVRVQAKPQAFDTGIRSQPPVAKVAPSPASKSDGTLSGASKGLSDFSITTKPKPAAAGFAPPPSPRPAAAPSPRPAAAPSPKPSPVSKSSPASASKSSSVSTGRKK